MKLLTLHPYGHVRKEAGVLYLLTRYLSEFGVEHTQLQCNGAFSQCDRDGSSHFRRKAMQCFSCMAEQTALANWSGAQVEPLSRFLLPDDVLTTKRWIEPMAAEQLWSAVWKGVPLRTLLQGSFSRRFGTLEPDFRNKQHDHFVRKLSLAALRMLTAALRCNSELRPDISLVTGGDEFISASFYAASRSTSARSTSSQLIRITAGAEARTMKFQKEGSDASHVTELAAHDILSYRTDIDSWPEEVREKIDAIIQYLGLEHLQMPLPLAR